jgi:hypothetical protein
MGTSGKIALPQGGVTLPQGAVGSHSRLFSVLYGVCSTGSFGLMPHRGCGSKYAYAARVFMDVLRQLGRLRLVIWEFHGLFLQCL